MVAMKDCFFSVQACRLLAYALKYRERESSFYALKYKNWKKRSVGGNEGFGYSLPLGGVKNTTHSNHPPPPPPRGVYAGVLGGRWARCLCEQARMWTFLDREPAWAGQPQCTIPVMTRWTDEMCRSDRVVGNLNAMGQRIADHGLSAGELKKDGLAYGLSTNVRMWERYQVWL